jgi:hypothetical protein
MKLTTEAILAYSRAFENMSSGQYDNFRLVACRVNGVPSLEIIALYSGDDEDTIVAQPLFVAITPGMVITDEDGRVQGGGGSGGPRKPRGRTATAASEVTEPHPVG